MTLFHLFQIFDKVQGNEFKLKIATMFRGFKRKVAIELQDGDGKIQAGKCPMHYSLYVRLKELMFWKSIHDHDLEHCL